MSAATGFRRVGLLGLLWLFYFGVLLFAALPRGLNTTHPEAISRYKPHFSLWADADEWLRAFDGADPGHYAKGGREIVTHGWVTTPFYAVTWPPGNYLIHAALQRLNAPIPLSLILLSCLLWACVFLQVFCFARRRLHPVLAAALPLATLATELMRLFFLHGWGPYLGEGPSCALLVLGFGFLVLALEPLAWPTGSASGDLRHTLWAGCCSGLCFAGSAYFRTHAELILTLLSLAFVTAALVSVLVAFRRSGLRPMALLRSLGVAWSKSGLLAVAVVVLSFHAATMPYRVLHNYRKHGSWQWTSYSYVWPLMWRNPANVPPGGAFFVQGGGRASAILAADWHVDAARLTTQQARALTLRVIRKRPGAWLGYKLPILCRYWLARNNSPGPIHFGYSYRENGAILVCLLVVTVAGFVGLCRRRFAATALWLLALTVCVAVACIGPSLVLHFEVRYLHPLKGFVLFLLLYGVVLTLRPRPLAQGEESVHDNANPDRRRLEPVAA